MVNNQQTLNLAFVCPRYKPRGAGGAEVLVSTWTERLAQKGHKVEVLTTCAEDHTTWKNSLPAGNKTDGEIIIRRFPVIENRNLDIWIPLQQKLENNQFLTSNEEKEWIGNSVHAPSLYEYLEKNKDQYDAIFIAPYLFGVSYQASLICPEKTIWIPCLHDEQPARCDIFKKSFNQSRGMFFNSSPEKELTQKLHDIEEEKSVVVGMGVEVFSDCNEERFRKKFSIKDPFILYAGRREGGKNVPLLLDYFTAYLRNNETDLKLVFLGSGDLHISEEIQNHVLDLGFVSEQDKMDAYHAAQIFCQPSTNESFSIVLLEAWLAGTPALVHQSCPVTKDHVVASRGGLYFNDFYQFNECLNLLTQNKELNSAMGKNGRDYVMKNYTWKVIEEKFMNGLTQVGII